MYPPFAQNYIILIEISLFIFYIYWMRHECAFNIKYKKCILFYILNNFIRMAYIMDQQLSCTEFVPNQFHCSVC